MKIKVILASMLTLIIILSSGVGIGFVLAADTPASNSGWKQRIDANRLVWTEVSPENPLGGADDFNAILFSEFRNFHETAAPVATRKINDVGIITFQPGQPLAINKYLDYTIPEYNISVITKQHIGKETNIFNGDAVVSFTEGGHFYLHRGSTFVKSADVIDQFLNAAYNDLKELHTTLWNMSGKKPTQNGPFLDLVCDSSNNITFLNWIKQPQGH